MNEKTNTAGKWLEAIECAGKKKVTEWEQRAKKVIDRYRDERNENDRAKKFNVLWSNIQTLTPAIYSRTPEPVVSRRFADKDQIGRAASEVLERSLRYSVESYDFDSQIDSVIEDYLLPGRGLARVVYEPSYGEPEPIRNENGVPQLDDKGELETFTPVVYEEARCEYVYWRDFRHGFGRTWDEVPWVAYRSFMTREMLVERFGKDGAKVGLNYSADKEDESQIKKAVVWEIWDKAHNRVVWVAESYSEILEESEPPLNLQGFFPSPRPLYSLVTNGSLIPVPDYAQYQDQADELDSLTARLGALIDAVKVAGFYAGEEEANLQQIFTNNADNTLVPVDSWAMWADKGGVKGLIDWYPVDTVMQVIQGLYQAREQTKQELYEITGLSDILRGATKAQETATAQQIKGQFATLRLSDKQDEVQRFIRDLVRLKGEIICEQFSIQTLQMITGLEYEPEMWQQIEQLFKNDPLRRFKIAIETDSTIKADEQADKESRIEFVTATSQFIEKAATVAQAVPALTPLYSELLMFAVRGFKTGRQLEETIEQTMQAVQQQPAQQPDPNQQIEVAEKQQKMQHAEREQNREDAQLQLDAAKTQSDINNANLPL